MLNIKIEPQNGPHNGPQRLVTQRLVLRAFTPEDAPAIQHYAGDWEVAQMLSRMPYPYQDGMALEWIARHSDMRAENREFPFAVTLEGKLIGCVGATLHADGKVEIGYWIGKPWWNCGYATEAARAAIGFAFGHFAVDQLVAGHFADNHASGTVLTKLGFRYTGEEQRWCEARQQEVHALTMALQRKDARL